MLNSGTLASKRQNTASPKDNDDISLLILRYLFPGQEFDNAEFDKSGSEEDKLKI
jgi:hypothetical protein